MPQKNLIYKHYNSLSTRQYSLETIDAYVTRLRFLTKSRDYGGFEEEMIRDHVVMSCVSSHLRLRLLREKDLSFELLQTNGRPMELSDHQTSKIESLQQHDDSINAIKRLSIDKKDTSNDRNRETKCFRCRKSSHLSNNKSVKRKVLLVIHVKRWTILFQSADLKTK